MELWDIIYVPTWLLLITAALIYYYLYSIKDNKYWSARGIRQIAPLPFIGSVDFQKSVHEIELERYNKYGRLYGYYEGKKPKLSVGDPELIKNILVKDFGYFVDRINFKTGDEIMDNMVSIIQGERWKRIRTIITPTFTSGKLKRLMSLMKESSSTLVSNFTTAAKEKKPCDAKGLFGAFAMDVICTTAFGTKIDSHNDPNNPIVSKAKTLFGRDISWTFLIILIFPWIRKLITDGSTFSDVNQFYKKVILDIIEERKKSGKTPNDFLQLMLDASKELPVDEVDEEEEEQEKGNSKVFRKPIANKNLSINELVAQAVIFFIAGYDTTATTLTLTSYFLAQNPDIQEKLIQEIDEMVPDSENLQYETIAELKYLDQVLSETLRIFPVVTRLERSCTQDYKLEDTGITIPKGSRVSIPVHGIHHDPEHYPDPETYNPDRFEPEVKATRHPFTYLPFGAGPRNCIGMRFGLLEMKVCLVTVLKHFRFKADPSQGPIEYFKGQPLLSPKSIMINVEFREDI